MGAAAAAAEVRRRRRRRTTSCELGNFGLSARRAAARARRTGLVMAVARRKPPGPYGRLLHHVLDDAGQPAGQPASWPASLDAACERLPVGRTLPGLCPA